MQLARLLQGHRRFRGFHGIVTGGLRGWVERVSFFISLFHRPSSLVFNPSCLRALRISFASFAVKSSCLRSMTPDDRKLYYYSLDRFNDFTLQSPARARSRR